MRRGQRAAGRGFREKRRAQKKMRSSGFCVLLRGFWRIYKYMEIAGIEGTAAAVAAQSRGIRRVRPPRCKTNLHVKRAAEFQLATAFESRANVRSLKRVMYCLTRCDCMSATSRITLIKVQ